MKHLIFGIVASLTTTVAFGATVTASWTHPTTYTDGSALAVAEIEHTRVEFGTCDSTGTLFNVKEGEVLAPAPATSIQITINTFGTKCFRAFTKVVESVGGLTSNSSAVVSKVIQGKKPRVPQNITVAIP